MQYKFNKGRIYEFFTEHKGTSSMSKKQLRTSCIVHHIAISSAHSVVVITSALHAEGLRFDPGWAHVPVFRTRRLLSCQFRSWWFLPLYKIHVREAIFSTKQNGFPNLINVNRILSKNLMPLNCHPGPFEQVL